jgi:hypothetical protein
LYGDSLLPRRFRKSQQSPRLSGFVFAKMHATFFKMQAKACATSEPEVRQELHVARPLAVFFYDGQIKKPFISLHLMALFLQFRICKK